MYFQTSLPIRKSVKPKPLNTSGNAVLSSSATQILKTLERLSVRYIFLNCGVRYALVSLLRPDIP